MAEVVPDKASGVSLLKDTRLPLETIASNYDAFREQGLSQNEALAETLDCYPEASIDKVKAMLIYRAAHQLQPPS